MSYHQEITCANEELILDADHALYWPRHQILFITDVHLGKVGHFQKEGIAIPGQLVENEYARLDRLLLYYDVQHLMCLGDLFHSHWNQEISHFQKWRSTHPSLSLTLLEGNHDRYMRKHYASLNIEVLPELMIEPFYLVHDWSQQVIPASLYALSGHLHPCVRLFGKGRQTFRMPCFWFRPQGAYLPAFGSFTGGHVITPEPQDDIYALAEDQVFSVKF